MPTSIWLFLVNDGFHAGQYTIRPMDPMAQWEQGYDFFGAYWREVFKGKG